MRNEKRLGVDICGVFHENPSHRLSDIEGIPALGGEESLEKIIAEKQIRQLILKDSLKTPPPLIHPLIRSLIKNVKELDILDFYMENWQKIPLYFITNERFFQEMKHRYPLPPYHERAKRLMDIGLSILGQMSLVGPRPEREYYVIQYLGKTPEEG